MSAECGTCGSDIVYPEGTWPLGECPTCTRDKRIRSLEEQLEAQREALRMIAMYATEPTRAGFLPGECALRVLETTGGDGAREGLPPLDSPPVSIPASSPLEKAQAFVRGEVQGKCCDLWPECSHVYEAVNSDTASSYPTLDDRNPASVVGVPWNEQGYAGDSDPASGERVAAGLPSSTSETSGANQSPEDSSPATEVVDLDAGRKVCIHCGGDAHPDECGEHDPASERCPVCEGLDQPGLLHNERAPYCSQASNHRI